MSNRSKRNKGATGAPITNGGSASATKGIASLQITPVSISLLPNQYENALIDKYISLQSPLKIFAANGWQEHGKIRAHDDKVIAVVHDPVDGICLMYKHALSTIEVEHCQRPLVINSDNFDFSKVLSDLQPTSPISNNFVEEHWLSKFIQSHSSVALIAANGYQEHGIILAHDEKVIVFIRYKGDSPKIMYKSTISTISMRY